MFEVFHASRIQSCLHEISCSWKHKACLFLCGFIGTHRHLAHLQDVYRFNLEGQAGETCITWDLPQEHSFCMGNQRTFLFPKGNYFMMSLNLTGRTCWSKGIFIIFLSRLSLKTRLLKQSLWLCSLEVQTTVHACCVKLMLNCTVSALQDVWQLEFS